MRLLLLVLLLAGALPASAATYYVRTDGGTAAQCTGAADAAYDGAGTGEACAWKSLSYALGTVSGGPARIVGGDVVVVKNGSYPIGYHADFDTTGCSSTSRSGCYLNAPPSGPNSTTKTRIIGQFAEIGCKVAPELWGTGGVNRIINIGGASNVDIQCLEITDHSPCVSKHYDAAKLCVSNTGDWGYQGVRGQTAANWTWKNVNIHGMAHFGMYISGLTDWTMESHRLIANGFGGWNGEITKDANDYNYGTLYFKNVEIAWNGCTENYPSIAIHACIGQNGDDYDGTGPVTKTAGSDGYGDGIGTFHTGGSWIFEDSTIHHNVQEGLDFLYLTQTGGSITVRRTISKGNGGNQMKLSGIILVENSEIIGDCDYFATPQRYYPALTIAGGDACRASGNPLVIRPAAVYGVAARIRHNTITGKGDMLVNISPGDLGADANTIVRFENNVFFGQAEYSDGSPTELAYIIPGTTKPSLEWANNHVWNVGATADVTSCPGDSFCTAAPQLRNTTMTAFDARPVSGSNVLGAGSTCSGACTTPAVDRKGRSRPNPPARGALEYQP